MSSKLSQYHIFISQRKDIFLFYQYMRDVYKYIYSMFDKLGRE